MIKFIQCVRGRPGLDLLAFRKFWQEYEKRVLRVAQLSGAVGATVDTTLAVDANLEVMTTRGTAPPYEGVAEIEWERAPEFARLAEMPEVRAAIAAMQALQAEFVDLERSTFFFTAARELLRRDSAG
jgi:hypothetical protein